MDGSKINIEGKKVVIFISPDINSLQNVIIVWTDWRVCCKRGAAAGVS